MHTAPVNVSEYLARMAAEAPGRPALHHPARGVTPGRPTAYTTYTFAALNADVDAIAHGLAAAGVGRGVRAALMVPPSPDFFALTFALLRVGAVPVLIDPGMGVRGLGKCLAEAEPGAFIGVPKAHLARRLLGWLRGSMVVTVNVGRWRWGCDTSLARLRAAGAGRGPYPAPELSPDDPAAVLFTSGSTGPAKGAAYTHGIFAAQVEALKATYGIQPGEIDLCTFPLFALFGPALGMTCVLPDMDPTRPARIDPRKAVQQVTEMGVTNLFGSPAVIRRLGDWGLVETVRSKTPPKLATLRRAISAGAPARTPDIEQFNKLLPDGVELFTPYGATEALPVANIGSREILSETRHLTDRGRGVCVGRPVAGVRVSVIPITDAPVPTWDDTLPLPAGEVGEFVVRGPQVTRAYFRRPEADAVAKIADPATGDVLHRMGDVGYLDERGRLWFCGRKSHRVVTLDGTLYTDTVEPVFNAVLGRNRSALVGVKRGGRTHPVVCVEYGPMHAPPGVKVRVKSWETIERELAEAARRFDHTRRITTFLRYGRPGFPVDVRHNSKIFREKLAVWADRTLGSNWRPGGNGT